LKLLLAVEAQRIAANIAKLPELLKRWRQSKPRRKGDMKPRSIALQENSPSNHRSPMRQKRKRISTVR
jgi:hypothetical protein